MRESLKAELLAEAERRIDELVRWTEGNRQPTLREIEEAVLSVRQSLSEKMTEAIVQRQEAVQPVPGPCCCECGEEMRYKDSHAKEVRGWVGAIKIERGYYYCDQCKAGLFPPRQAT